jgi:hypothetical protein
VATEAQVPAGIRDAAEYSVELDCLRGLAILLVLFFHATGIVAPAGESHGPWLSFIYSGHTGVTLFFVLSAFLLSRPFLLQARGGRPAGWKHFWERRALRILPLYFCAVAVGTYVRAENASDFLEAIPYLFFLNGLPGGAEPLQNGTWDPLYRLPEVPDPTCQGSVIQWKSTTTGHPKEWILFANPATGGRNGMTLRVSLDGGLTWPISRLVYAGPSAYSSLCILPDETIGLLYEKDSYGSINFVRVDEGWLLDPDADFDADGMSDSWEILWDTDPGVDDADEDPDQDGLTNIEEMTAGTDPQDGGSRFWVSDFTPGDSSVQLSWESVPGKAYQVSQSDDLATWETVPGFRVVATGSLTMVDVPLEGGVTQRFYRTTVIP